MREYCQCHRHNPDDRLRDAERQVQATNDPADWDRYLNELDRAGLLVPMLADIEATLPQGWMIGGQASRQGVAVGGPVTKGQAILLMRILGYQYRAGLIDLKELQRWETEGIRQAILGKSRQSSSKIPEQLSGYYWVRYTPPSYETFSPKHDCPDCDTRIGSYWRSRELCNMCNGVGWLRELEGNINCPECLGARRPVCSKCRGTGEDPNRRLDIPCDCSIDQLAISGCRWPTQHLPRRFYPIRLLSSREAITGGATHRVLLLCPICEKEIPAGRMLQHLRARNHQRT